MPEARLEDFGSGLTPVSDGWFVVNDIVDNLPTASAGVDVRADFQALAGVGRVLDVDSSGTTPRYRFFDEALPTFLWLRIARDHLRAGGDTGEVWCCPARRQFACERAKVAAAVRLELHLFAESIRESERVVEQAIIDRD